MTLRRAAALGGGVVAVAALAAAIWLLVWVTHYAPLDRGSLGWPVRPASAGVVVGAAAASDGKDVLYLRARYNRTFRYAFSIRNDGGQPVTLLGVPGAGYVGGEFLKAVAVSIGPHDLNEGSGGLAGGSAGQLRPLSSSSPARLGSHDDRLVSLTFRLDARCPGGQARDLHSGTTTEWVSTLPIRFRVWGVFTRTQDVPLPTNIAIACKGNRIDVTR